MTTIGSLNRSHSRKQAQPGGFSRPVSKRCPPAVLCTRRIPEYPVAAEHSPEDRLPIAARAPRYCERATS